MKEFLHWLFAEWGFIVLLLFFGPLTYVVWEKIRQ